MKPDTPKQIVAWTKNFAVVKECKNFYSVYKWNRFDRKAFGELITSGDTLGRAVKKMKLLQTGYDISWKIDRHS